MIIHNLTNMNIIQILFAFLAFIVILVVTEAKPSIIDEALNITEFEDVKIISNPTDCDYGLYMNNGICAECTINEIKPNPKIVGGIIAIPHSWPAQVLIIQTYKGVYNFWPIGANATNVSVQFRCGGTLINQNTILTAGHCIVTDFDYMVNGFIISLGVKLNEFFATLESMFEVYLGVHDSTFLRTNSELPNSVTKLGVSKIISHPKFNVFGYLNDIALLKLNQTVEVDSFVNVACLPSINMIDFPPFDEDSYASGWGTLFEGGPVSSELQNVQLKIYNTTLCDPVIPFFKKDWRLQICAGQYSGYKDTCQGDSGGGLYIYDPKIKKYILGGVTSYGYGCGRPMSPGIYTKVQAYLEWIYLNW